jgi:phosphoglycolate phosphatase
LKRLDRAHDADILDHYYPVLLEAYAKDIDSRTTMYDGAMDAVETLKTLGYGVGIATNKPAGLAEELLRRLGVRDVFASMIGADTLAVRKPDPEHLFEAARRAGGGVPCVLVTFGPAGGDMAALKPEALLDKYVDLPEIVTNLLG